MLFLENKPEKCKLSWLSAQVVEHLRMERGISLQWQLRDFHHCMNYLQNYTHRGKSLTHRFKWDCKRFVKHIVTYSSAGCVGCFLACGREKLNYHQKMALGYKGPCESAWAVTASWAGWAAVVWGAHPDSSIMASPLCSPLYCMRNIKILNVFSWQPSSFLLLFFLFFLTLLSHDTFLLF